MKITSYTLTILLSIFICGIGCEEKIIVQRSSESEFDHELIDVWTLIEADHLWEGDLIIDAYGTGVEYVVDGRNFKEQKHDFTKMEYSIEGNILTFKDRKYKRNITEKKRSPNFIFPDEGLVKLFLIDDILPFVVKVGYNSNLDLFYKKLSIWSPQFGYEVDTLWYRVLEDFICPAYFRDPTDKSTTIFGRPIDDPKNFGESFFDPPLWHTIYDTTLTSGNYNITYQGPSMLSIHWSPDFSGRDSVTASNSYFMRFSEIFAHDCLVTSGLGTIYTEWENDWPIGNGGGVSCPVFHHVATLVGYYNPLDNYDAGYKSRIQ